MRLCRREFIRMTGLTLSGCLAAERQAAAGEKTGQPNIILIMADDMGAECIESYGGTSYKTPRIDALAAAGVRFENAFSMPICGPTRACILSGRYPFRSGVATNHGTKGFGVPWGRGEKPEITFANLLKKQGYATGIAGKWALCHFDKAPDHVMDCGFDKYSMFPKVYRSKLTHRYWNPASYQDGVFHPRIEGVFGPDRECDYLIEFIRNNKDRPFLAYWPMTLVHGPLLPPPGSKVRPMKDRKRKLIMLHRLNVEYMDRLIGRLTDAVDKMGLAEKTLIIFTSDNGTHRRIPSMLGDRKIQGGKGKVFDAGTRVPFVARWTGVIKPGRVLEDLVDFSDVLPTFAELAGAQVPKDRVIDGRSFAPQLRGEKGNPREWVYFQNDKARAVRGIRWQVNESGELFDLSDRYNPVLIEPGKGGPDAEAARKRLTAALESIK